MALAVAAVFGAVTLSPGAAKADKHPDRSMTVYTGLDVVVDLKALFSASDIPVGSVITVEQEPDAVLGTTTLAGTPVVADTALTLTLGQATIPAGAPSLMTTVSVESNKNTAADDDDVTKRVAVTVMRSTPTKRNTTSGDSPENIDIEKLDLYTDVKEDHDVGVWTSGNGTGMIVGYMVTGGANTATAPAETDGVMVTDAFPGTESNSKDVATNVNPSGMAELAGSDDDTLAALTTNPVTLSVVPVCQTALGTFGTCFQPDSDGSISANAHAGATFTVKLVKSEMTEATIIDLPAPDADLMLLDDSTTERNEREHRVMLIGNADKDLDHYTNGKGKGEIKRWVVRSSDQFKARATVSSLMGKPTLIITAREAGRANITVFPVDGYTPLTDERIDELSKSVEVRVAARAMEEENSPATWTGRFLPQVNITLGSPENPMDQKMVDVSQAFAAGQGTGAVTGYPAQSNNPSVARVAAVDGEGMVTVQGINPGSTRIVVEAVDRHPDPNPTASFLVVVSPRATVEVTDSTYTPWPGGNRIAPSSFNPGKNASYTIQFNAPIEYLPGVQDIVVQFTEDDFVVPDSIDEASVVINSAGHVANPASVSVDGEEITLELQDMDGDTDGVQGIGENARVRVIFRTSAGIKNPTEGGDYGDMTVAGLPLNEVTVYRTLSLSEEDGGRGDQVTATGKGFRNGTTLRVFLDVDKNGLLGANDHVLCVSERIGSDDIGQCTFKVTSSRFMHGPNNVISAVDGRSNYVTQGKTETFELKSSISLSPEGGSPGETIQVQLYDFGANATVTKVEIARRALWEHDSLPIRLSKTRPEVPAGTSAYRLWNPGAGAASSRGELSFSLVIPNEAPSGVQDFKVFTSGGDDNTTITIGGPQITVTPSTVLANQRISLVGVGFSANAVIGRERDNNGQQSRIEIRGQMVDWDRVNNGDPVDTDSGGNWSASVDLPLDSSTIDPGNPLLRITDSDGRTGVTELTIPSREVTITPSSGRVGTLAVVRGTGFPSKNDEGTSFNVEVVYDAGNDKTTRVSAVPDASGRFEVQLRIPTTASIPSTNPVRVSFEIGTTTSSVTVSHDVPEGILELSATSGGPGSTITIHGEGFKSFVPVSSVRIGNLDITPSPKPSTDGNGMMDFDVTIPGLDVGIQTIEVQVGQTTASVGFTVTESGIAPGDIKPVSEALEPLGDNLESIWHFNNDTKVWSFYDGLDGSDLENLITGETYLVQVKATMEVILNHKTRNLTCNEGNCWNQVVW